jgi:hypothetical protein
MSITEKAQPSYHKRALKAPRFGGPTSNSANRLLFGRQRRGFAGFGG